MAYASAEIVHHGQDESAWTVWCGWKVRDLPQATMDEFNGSLWEAWNAHRGYILARVTCRKCIEEIIAFGEAAVRRFVELEHKASEEAIP